MSKMFNNYIGKAGQLFAMSEFLMRGWNVAIPEVDRGEDICVVQDSDETLRRVQVKSSQAIPLQKGYYAEFNIPYRQIVTALTPDIHFFLLVRHDKHWKDVLIISRELLENELAFGQNNDPILENKKPTLHIRFIGDKIICRQKDFTHYRSNFTDFSQINH
ncbi:PDDEXK-like family protein [Spirosoma aerolatum]|uniref:hypothetical protein n=1 Tax=Spirosoma aerolatum TaxID=1211326 RepID=UPI0009AC5917|nr:hypothetical protein [Spirosoma aerolatum]